MTVAVKNIYRSIRSIAFTLVLLVIGLVAVLYVALSIPAVRDRLRGKAETELSSLLGGKVEIASAEILPFNEVRLFGVSISSPSGEKCISVGRLGTSLNLWKLISERRFEFSYVEIISLDAKIRQDIKEGPLNIDFIIRALSPKEKKKEPTKFDLTLKNIVIRKSYVSFDRNFIPVNTNGSCSFDPNHIKITNLRADIELPKIANDDFTIDIKRLALVEQSGIDVRSLALFTHITPKEIDISNFKLQLADAILTLNDQNIKIAGFKSIAQSLRTRHFNLQLDISNLVPSQLASFYLPLKNYDKKLNLSTSLSGMPDNFEIDSFRLENLEDGSVAEFRGTLTNLITRNNFSGEIKSLNLDFKHDFIVNLGYLINKPNPRLSKIIDNIGNVHLSASSKFDIGKKRMSVLADLSSGVGNVKLSTDFEWNNNYQSLSNLYLSCEDVNINCLADNAKFGYASADLKGQLTFDHGDVTGSIIGNIPSLEFNNEIIKNISIVADKTGQYAESELQIRDDSADLSLLANATLDGMDSELNMNADIRAFMPGKFGIKAFSDVDNISGILDLSLSGNSVENVSGEISISNLNLQGARQLTLANARIVADRNDDQRKYSVSSDIINGYIQGSFTPDRIIGLTRNMLASAFPMFIQKTEKENLNDVRADYEFIISPDNSLWNDSKLPVKPIAPVTVSGFMDGNQRLGNLSLDAPVILQGKNKIIKGTHLNFDLSDDKGLGGRIKGNLPVKNGIADVDINLGALSDRTKILLEWTMENNPDNRGSIGVEVNALKDLLTGKISAQAQILESNFKLKESDWKVAPAAIICSDKNITIANLHISNGSQFIDIKGSASESPMDAINVELVGIDLDYVFDILNINNVDFGGIATGKALISGLFTKTPIARTDGLFVKSLSYNESVLGDGELESHWDNQNKMVAINADINSADKSWATVRGGIFVTRDSLSFDFDTHRLDIGFLKPFMSGFTSSMKGRASGQIKLFGTFSDMDLLGRAHADTITMKVDHTNVYYSGSDSIFFTHGRIDIPPMNLYDKYGNKAVFKGVVTHDYLHDAAFDFNLSDARKLLIYDMGKSKDSQWCGHVFASGSAALHGVPGLIDLKINMTTDPGSEFTLSLDETETASEYSFLTFSDKNKTIVNISDTIVDAGYYVGPIISSSSTDIYMPSDVFSLDMNLDITPGVKMIIIMDPNAGDKITAYGAGGMRMHYDTNSDEFSIYGKYTLNHGDYNFSLQDLILKNFKIVEGSAISFNGDPMLGILDITAAYRVNTNLTDLDQSFSSDPDLNRTSIPVDALLKVKGDIHAPEIKFDLSFPTVTSDVERKVRSIVSTEDMMNKQVIYLLALNRFYTPEYTGAEQGGEFSSVASSTISSQIQNVIGSLTDKFSLAPSFKSEKDDFSDMEVDVALSSRLLDNRLLLNGNFGYRDKSTSQTTFIGDFDLEYFLSRDGRLRLKAYNHFNDASYYLKSALTTQGIGVKYHKDFDDPFTFIKRLFRKRSKVKPGSSSD